MSANSDGVAGSVSTNGMPFSDEQDVAILELIYKHKAHLASAGNRFSSMRPVTTDYLRQKLSTPIVPGRFASPHIIYWRFLHLVRSRPMFSITSAETEAMKRKLKILDDIIQERQDRGMSLPTTLPITHVRNKLPTKKRSAPGPPNTASVIDLVDKTFTAKNSKMPFFLQSEKEFVCDLTTERFNTPGEEERNNTDREWHQPLAVRRKLYDTSNYSTDGAKRASIASLTDSPSIDVHDDLNPTPVKSPNPVHPVATVFNQGSTPAPISIPASCPSLAPSPAPPAAATVFCSRPSASQDVCGEGSSTADAHITQVYRTLAPDTGGVISDGFDATNAIQGHVDQENDGETQAEASGAGSTKPKTLTSTRQGTTYTTAANGESPNAALEIVEATAEIGSVKGTEGFNQNGADNALAPFDEASRPRNRSDHSNLLSQIVQTIHQQLDLERRDRQQIKILSEQLANHHKTLTNLLVATDRSQRSLITLCERLTDRREKLTDALVTLYNRFKDF